MEEDFDLEDLHRSLVQQWGIWPVGRSQLGRDALVEELRRRIGFLMRHDLERLMNCMYILDVPEEKFAEAVQRPPQEAPDRILAEIVLEREVQRRRTRRRFTETERTEISVRIEGRPPRDLPED